ncbi:unnamed protein product [Spirodela intermedia]|uniref:Uncharacterized protein n=1 Tax=Spirodela intermedia TaxID=51605 RepID=A0A7I8KPN7_SPIIN|nr:unnamed protein product [Spirodela intermedia]
MRNQKTYFTIKTYLRFTTCCKCCCCCCCCCS